MLAEFVIEYLLPPQLRQCCTSFHHLRTQTNRTLQVLPSVMRSLARWQSTLVFASRIDIHIFQAKALDATLSVKQNQQENTVDEIEMNEIVQELLQQHHYYSNESTRTCQSNHIVIVICMYATTIHLTIATSFITP